MDGTDDAAAAAVVYVRDGRGRWAWSQAIADEIVRRSAAGETLRGMCREPGMPSFETVQKWLRKRPAFRAAVDEARVAAGLPWRGPPSTYCEATAEAIWVRLAAGEPLVKILADPEMPAWSTVHRWMHQRPEFRRALHSARVWIAECAFQTGWEICMGVTPATAQAAKVQLAHLRWHTGKLAPKTYGAQKAVDVTARTEGALHTYVKKFVMGTGDEPGRWSEEPAVHLSSMVPVDDKGPNAGAPLPPPEAVREPRSCQGPNPTFEPRGGAVEAEFDGEDGLEDGADDDDWAGVG